MTRSLASLTRPAIEEIPIEARPTVPLTADQLYRSHARYVYSISLRLLGRDSEVDDVVQDVFLAAVRHLDQLRDPAAVRGWLATTTVRAASQRLRARRVRAFFGLDRPADYEQIVDPQASAEDRTHVARVYALLDQMAVGERVAWCLRYFSGAPLAEVARHCGCSLATAKRRIAAVNERLERSLADAGT